ncbi:hypothetical protein NUITMVA1_36090 [Aeromonas hydrophila]|nr:hypothetical protein NUITMVA1_36090 [Aeromonas hydrophila]
MAYFPAAYCRGAPINAQHPVERTLLTIKMALRQCGGPFLFSEKDAPARRELSGWCRQRVGPAGKTQIGMAMGRLFRYIVHLSPV